MPISGGSNRRDLRPHNPEPNVYGSHRGSSSALNVRNPVPGMVYSWGLRDQNYLLRKSNLGWRVVPPDSPETKGPETDPNFSYALDGAAARSDIVLLRIPEAQFAEIQREKHRQAQAKMDGSTEAYLSKGESLERKYGAGADGPILYRNASHSSRTE